MSFVCLRIPAWPTGTSGSELAAVLLGVAPHMVSDAQDLVWLDARGLNGVEVARQTLDVARRYGIEAPRVGLASTAIAAEVAAVYGQAALVRVPVGVDVPFLSAFPLAVLSPSARLAAALAAANLNTCGDLARQAPGVVATRFGSEGIALWHLARAKDARQLFASASPVMPSASVAWENHVLHDAERVTYVANRLVATVCAELRAWGEMARTLTLGVTLADRSTIERPLYAAQETASRTAWMRRIRPELEGLELTSGVTGLSLRAHVARTPRRMPVAINTSARPTPLPARERRIAVVAAQRGHQYVPVRFRTLDGRETELLTAIRFESGVGQHFTCLTENGLVVLLLHEVQANAWYLEGWWD